MECSNLLVKPWRSRMKDEAKIIIHACILKFTDTQSDLIIIKMLLVLFYMYSVSLHQLIQNYLSGSKQFKAQFRFWGVLITTLYNLMLQSWYQKTAQPLVNMLLYIFCNTIGCHSNSKTPGGVLGISSDGDDRMEPKVKTQKNPLGFQQNSKKSLDQKLTPQNIPCRFCGP